MSRMRMRGASTQWESDSRNPVSYALTDFFDLIVRAMMRKGMCKRDARAEAYDAVELRFNISKSRARNIMYAVRGSGDQSQRMKPNFYIDNQTLIKLLEDANAEYIRQGRNR